MISVFRGKHLLVTLVGIAAAGFAVWLFTSEGALYNELFRTHVRDTNLTLVLYEDAGPNRRREIG
jgi:hypothetical protein